jgi:hypothetical protein
LVIVDRYGDDDCTFWSEMVEENGEKIQEFTSSGEEKLNSKLNNE